MRRPTRMLLTSLTGLAACDVPGVTLVRPAATGGEAPLAIYVALEDSAMAEALGWTAGVPGATVVIHRFTDPFRPDTLYTDATGWVTLSGLVPGWYLVAGYRLLRDEETGRTGGAVRAFGDGVKVELLRREPLELVLRGDDRGSLMFSEVYFGGGTIEIRYGFEQFFEVYNNSDTIAFVDGMLLGRAFSMVGSNDPCTDHAGVRADRQGLWTTAFHRFPGAGTDHPIAPGRSIIIALDAVDHSVVHPSLPDLSNADFELEGTADSDNPDVPNMPELSPIPHALGHGMHTIPNAAHFLALPVMLEDLPRRLVGSVEYVRIPTARVVDVVQTHWLSDSGEPPFPLDEYCEWVHAQFDRLEAPYYRPGGDNRTSNHRRVLRDDGAGWLLLHDVNTSFVDWLLAPYSPGRIE